jgi:hypothetical protein
MSRPRTSLRANLIKWDGPWKITLAWDFTSGFSRKRTHFVPWFILWICFEYNFFYWPKYLNFRLILFILRIWGKKICKPEWITIFFLDGLGSSCTCTSYFLKKCPIKRCWKKCHSEYSDLFWRLPQRRGINLGNSQNMRSKTVHIHGTQGTKLCTVAKYVKLFHSLNRFDLGIF